MLMKAKEIISKITDNLFLDEPLMFDVLCSHTVEENPNMNVMFRTGQGKLQYNPSLVEKENFSVVKEKLEIEIMRILLKHPYERVPENPNRKALGKASDMTIRENSNYTEGLISSEYYNLKQQQSYEDYYKELKYIIKDEQQQSAGGDRDNCSGDSGGLTDLWAEDEQMSEKIQKAINKASKTGMWGSVTGNMEALILANEQVKFPYEAVLHRFRNHTATNTRKLTRLRPNRRYGYDYMGSRYNQKMNLLVAIDDSGSIGDDDLKQFFSIINRFFKHGMDKIQVITFDTEIKQELKLKKAKKEIKIKGRGGTNFQAAVDYFEKAAFDGMIIFTDGFAPEPKIKNPQDVLWVLTTNGNLFKNFKRQSIYLQECNL